MSVIKKIPAIETILGRLDATQLAAVKTAINSTTPEVQKSFLNPSIALSTLTSESPTDIATYQLQLDSQKTRNGLIIRVLKSNVLYEHFLVYGESQKITIYEINSTTHKYALIEEYCDINELRRILDEKQESGGDEWVEKMKSELIYNDDTNTIEAGGHLEADGNVKTDCLASKSEVSEENVVFAKFNPTGHQDNHWHIVNTKVDDTLYVNELVVLGLTVFDLSEIGSTFTGDELTDLLKAYASGMAVSYDGTILKMEYYKPLNTAQTDDVVLVIQSVIHGSDGAVTGLEKFTFTKQADGSMSVAHVSI